MALSKAAGVIHTRTLLREKGKEAEAKLLSRLTPEEQVQYLALLPVSKIPIETATKIYLASVPILFPDKTVSQGMQELARSTALNDMRGVYSILLRFTTPEFMIKQTAKIWQTYHDAGEATAEHVGPKQALLRVTRYPDLPKAFLDIVSGYILGLFQISGVKNTQMQVRDHNPEAWEWLVSWD
ncbi:MAG: DUF2378 family protein [candidate division FCPU426 bacterium]